MTLSDRRKFTELAEVIGNGSSPQENMLEKAALIAKERVLSYCSGQATSPPWNDYNSGESMFAVQSQKPFRAKTGGGGMKAASDKQKEWISNLCAKQGLNVNSVTMEKVGKSLDNLQGSDADIIIKALKG